LEAEGPQRFKLQCPLCQEGVLEVLESYYDIPFFGRAALTSMACSKCGYRRSDVASLEVRPPCRCEVKVEGPEDLSLRVVRSSTATITIPELGVEVKPGLIAEGFISNVEGVLRRVERVLEQLLRDAESPEEEAEARRALERLRAAAEGRLSFTLIIDDPYGNSFIAPKQLRGALGRPSGS
jgi:zinc finger protein